MGTATFGDGEKAPHDFSVAKIDKEYYVSKANCERGALYAYSRSLCGDKSPYQTFSEGESVPHNYNVKCADGKE